MSAQNERTFNVVLSHRGGVSTVLASQDPYLLRREIMIEKDTGKLKIGDGVHSWNNLPYVGVASNSEVINAVVSSLSISVFGVEDNYVLPPTVGDQYIVGSSPTGDFAGVEPNTIARYKIENDVGFWDFITPEVGTNVVNIRNGEVLLYNGNDWVVIATLELQSNVKFITSMVVSEVNQYAFHQIPSRWNSNSINATVIHANGLEENVSRYCTFEIYSTNTNYNDTSGQAPVPLRQINNNELLDYAINYDNGVPHYFNFNVIVKYNDGRSNYTGILPRTMYLRNKVAWYRAFNYDLPNISYPDVNNFKNSGIPNGTIYVFNQRYIRNNGTWENIKLHYIIMLMCLLLVVIFSIIRVLMVLFSFHDL